ncbi:MAG: hypothetical protein V3T77_06795, partial [Planctomycetota bacterium]
CGCALFPSPLPDEPLPLHDMEEPLAYFQEPEDEAARKEIPWGSFTGIAVRDAATNMEQLVEQQKPHSEREEGQPLQQSEGVMVAEVVDHSPGDRAGIKPGDLLLEVLEVNGMEQLRPLQWPGDWRKVELEALPRSTLLVRYDRAGVSTNVRLELLQRIRPRERDPVVRYREEQRVGAVFRTATEVEARAAGLGPGGGAVLVGLAKGSPWRRVGLRYQDLIVEAAGRKVDHPQVLIEAIRESPYPKGLTLHYLRQGEEYVVQAPVSRRAGELRKFSLPPLFSYEKERGVSETSFLFWIFQWKRTTVAWEFRFLWFFKFAGGEADRLEKVDE